MEHYPDIQRRDGTLFFACPDSDRAAIATSIERLIDMLDAMEGDPDLEPYMASFDWGPCDDREDDAGDCREADYADDEPMLAAAERHPNAMSWNDAPEKHTQERWAAGGDDDREDDGDDLEPSLLSADYRWGRVEVDLEADGSDDEYSHGWTSHIDQNVALMNCSGQWSGEGEPDLGWTGHGIGFQSGEGIHEHDEEREEDPAENGIADADAMQDPGMSFNPATFEGFDGSGSQRGRDMIRGLPIAAKRADAYALAGGHNGYRFEP